MSDPLGGAESIPDPLLPTRSTTPKKVTTELSAQAMEKVQQACNKLQETLQETPSKLPTREEFLQHVRTLTEEEPEDLQQHATHIAEQIFHQVFPSEAEHAREVDQMMRDVGMLAAGRNIAELQHTSEKNVPHHSLGILEALFSKAERMVGNDPMSRLEKKIAYCQTIAEQTENKMRPNTNLGVVDTRNVLEYTLKFDMVPTGIAGLTNDPVATSWGPKFFAKSISNLKALGEAGGSFFQQLIRLSLSILNLVFPITAIIKKIRKEEVDIEELIPIANFFFRISKAMKNHDKALSELAQTGIGALSVELYNLVGRSIDFVATHLCMLLFLDGRNFINGLIGFTSSFYRLVAGFVKAPYNAYKRWEDRCEIVTAKTMDCPAGHRMIKFQALELSETTARAKGTLNARFFEIRSSLENAYNARYDKTKAETEANTAALDKAIAMLEKVLLEEVKLGRENEHGRCVHNTNEVPEGLNPFNLMENLRENSKRLIPELGSAENYNLQMCLEMQMISFIQKITNEIKPPPTAEEVYAITIALVDKWTKAVDQKNVDQWKGEATPDDKIARYAAYLNSCFENVSMGMIEAKRATLRLAQSVAMKEGHPLKLGAISGKGSLIELLHTRASGGGFFRDRAPEQLLKRFTRGPKPLSEYDTKDPTETFTSKVGLANDMLGAWFKNIGQELTNMAICLGHALPAWAGPVLAVLFPPVGIPIVVGKIVQFLSQTAGLSDIVGYGGSFFYLSVRAGKEARSELLHIVHPMNGTEGAMLLAYLAHLASTAINTVASMFHHPAILVGKFSPSHVGMLVFAAALTAQLAKFCGVFVRELWKGSNGARACAIASKGEEYVKATTRSKAGAEEYGWDEEHICTTITRIDNEIATNPLVERQRVNISTSMVGYLERAGTQFYRAQGALHSHEAPEMASVWEQGERDQQRNIPSLSRVLYESVLHHNKELEKDVSSDFRTILKNNAEKYGLTIIDEQSDFFGDISEYGNKHENYYDGLNEPLPAI
ncbi:hypothetical protein JYU14_03105 [Simkania negevensis]|uniref:Uncharacterized protein n=1 Tax=Simkania negevensis TaxID=83561 RepID=A0ABS3ARV3_9BACT|nr:hypothetical protein [Simkania negevensis]